MPYRLLDPNAAEAAPIVEFGLPLTDVGETLATFRADLFSVIGERTNAPNEAGGKLDKWINKAYRQMMGSIKLKECYAGLTIPLVIDQPFYLLPVQLASIRSVTLINSSWPNGGRKLIPIDENQYTRLPDDNKSDPTNYFRYGRGGQGMLVVYCDPKEVLDLTVEGRIRPDDLADDMDSPILPPDFHDAMLMMARHLAFRDLEDWAKSAQAKNDYLEAIGPLLSTDADEDAELPSGVQFIKDPRDMVRLNSRRTQWRQNLDL